MMTSPPGLVAKELGVRRAGRVILEGASFTLDSTEILVVIGANGAGKTTLLEAVVGAVRTSSGSIAYGSGSLTRFGARAKVFSYMPDAMDSPAEVRVAALLQDAQRAGRVPPERARLLATRLGLDALQRAYAGELSRGEKRRVLLHSALCTTRPIIVLDEPLGAFDPLQLLEVLNVLRESAQHGAALLMSVHQLSDAEKIASRVLILHQGRVVGFGSLPELRDRVSQPHATLEQVFLRILELEC